MPTPFRLTDEQAKVLRERFPDWLFIQTSSQGHDHPVSHCTTMIATHEMIKALPSGTRAAPTIYLDLHGNPKANARMCPANGTKRIITVVNCESPRDFLRLRTKWGPQFVNGQQMYIICGIRDLARDHADLLATVDCILSFHTIYYYDMEEIVNTIAATKGKLMRAVLHRHKEESGYLNNKELSWTKERATRDADSLLSVRQTNVKTGESYVHPDSEKWFVKALWSPHKDMVAALQHPDREDCLTWTTNACCDGTFNITATCVPSRVCAMDTLGAHDSKPTTAKPNSPTSIRRTNKVSFKVLNVDHEIDVIDDHIDLFDECRKNAHNKPRDDTNFRSHVNFVKVKCRSVMGPNVTLDIHQMRDIALGSFWVDFEHDVTVHSGSSFFARTLAGQHNAMLRGKSFFTSEGVVDILLDGLIIALTGKSVKDSIHKALVLAKSTR